MDFYEDGSLLVTASDDDSIRMYKTDTGVYVLPLGSRCPVCGPPVLMLLPLLSWRREHKVIFSRKHGVDLIRFTHSNSCVVCASRPSIDDRTGLCRGKG